MFNSNNERTKPPILNLNLLAHNNPFLVLLLKYTLPNKLIFNELVPNLMHNSNYLVFYLTCYEVNLIKLKQEFLMLSGGVGYREFYNEQYQDYSQAKHSEIRSVKLFFVIDNTSLLVTPLGFDHMDKHKRDQLKAIGGDTSSWEKEGEVLVSVVSSVVPSVETTIIKKKVRSSLTSSKGAKKPKTP